MTATAMTTSATALAAGTWVGDPVHSHISFGVRHMGVGRVRGTFALAAATLTIDGSGAPSASVTATIDVASVDTGSDQRDAHLCSADFLDVNSHPTIEFTSREVRDFDGARFVLTGELTVHGVTKIVELESEFDGVVTDPFGVERSGFSARTTISRAAFGVDIHVGFGAGNVVIADAIDIAIDIEFTSAGSEHQ